MESSADQPCFQYSWDGQIARSLQTKRTFRNAGVETTLAADLKKKCVAPPKCTDLFPFPKAEGGVRPSNQPIKPLQQSGSPQ
jgi:hypothetical protein